MAVAVLVIGLASASVSQAGERPLVANSEVTQAMTASSPTIQMVAWVRETANNQGLPFLIIDKVSAQVVAFDADGRMLGSSAVLLGLAQGDVSPSGIGDRPLSAITPEERITPAGRFLASLGENLGGKSILWIDYDAALSLHPVVTTRAADRRLQRLASVAADDNRISYGCVNVPLDFFDEIVKPSFKGSMGVVYILPEFQSLSEVFFASQADPELTL